MANKKILIVDDSETIRKLVAMTLCECHVVSASNGKEGLSAYQSEIPDLIITDYNMPVMNGAEFLRELRKNDQDTPVIFLTTESEETLRKDMFQNGANGWITKPVKIDSLRGLVSKVLC